MHVGGRADENIHFQVFFLTGKDYNNYFTTVRPDPCITRNAGQLSFRPTDTSDPCLAGKQITGCRLAGCNKSNPLLCIDPYCFSASCFQADQTTPWTNGCPSKFDSNSEICCNDNFLTSSCLNQPCTASGDSLSGIFRQATFIIYWYWHGMCNIFWWAECQYQHHKTNSTPLEMGLA